METKRHPVNLKQYRKVNGKWQFVPVARDAKGNPDPRLVLVDGESVSSKGGTFYLDFSDHGIRRQESVGKVPREALEAWRTKRAVLTGLIEPEDEPEEAERGLTIDQAIQKYLVEVEATKGGKTYRQYRNELEWFWKHCKKRYVSQLNRGDAMALFAQGRKELVDGRPLNQKTINDLYTKRCKEEGVKIHPARFPALLPKFFVKLLTDPNDLVLDPFAGSLTAGAVSEQLDRRWIAGEAVEEYLKAGTYRFQGFSQNPMLF